MNEEKNIFIPGPSGQIEALVTITDPHRVAIMCHPHSLHGGSMNNKVVTTVTRMLASMGITTVRFNFRSVGHSEGVYADGLGEQEDLQAVIQYCQDKFQPAQWMLAGFSFGSFVSHEVARTFQPDILLSVAPPVENFRFGEQAEVKTWIVIQSDDDEIVPAEQVYDWLASCHPQPELIRFQQAGHFFHGKLVELRDRLKPLIERAWP